MSSPSSSLSFHRPSFVTICPSGSIKCPSHVHQVLPFVHLVPSNVFRSFLVCPSVAVFAVFLGALVLLVHISFARQWVGHCRLVWKLVLIGGILSHSGKGADLVVVAVRVGFLVDVPILRFYFPLSFSFWRENYSFA